MQLQGGIDDPIGGSAVSLDLDSATHDARFLQGLATEAALHA